MLTGGGKILKKILLLCLLAILWPLNQVGAQEQLLVGEVDEVATTYTFSGYKNRWLDWAIDEFGQELADYSQDPATVIIFNDGLEVGLRIYTTQDDLVEFHLRFVEAEQIPTYEELESLVLFIDPEFDQEALEDAYEIRSGYSQREATIDAGPHQILVDNGGSGPQIEVIYRYSQSLFEDGTYADLLYTPYDASRDPIDLYEEAYNGPLWVERPYINAMLNRMNEDWGFEVTEDHLESYGNTVHYYSQELAEVDRINEFYFFSGLRDDAGLLSVRYTMAMRDGSDLADYPLTEQYFTYFVRLLDSDLTDSAIKDGFEQALANRGTRGESSIEVGEVTVHLDGYGEQTYAMSREFEADNLTDFTQLDSEQPDQALIPEDVWHTPQVAVIAPRDIIFQSQELEFSSPIFRSSFEELTDPFIDQLHSLQGFGSQYQLTGTVIEQQDGYPLFEVDSGERYYLITPLVAEEFVGKELEITGSDHGIVNYDEGIIALFVQRIDEDGQVLFERGEGNE